MNGKIEPSTFGISAIGSAYGRSPSRFPARSELKRIGLCSKFSFEFGKRWYVFKNKALIPIFVVVFVDLLGFSIVLPLLPFYAQDFQASPETIGIFVASYSVFQ